MLLLSQFPPHRGKVNPRAPASGIVSFHSNALITPLFHTLCSPGSLPPSFTPLSRAMQPPATPLDLKEEKEEKMRVYVG